MDSWLSKKRESSCELKVAGDVKKGVKESNRFWVSIRHWSVSSKFSGKQAGYQVDDKKAVILGSTPALSATADTNYNYSVTELCMISGSFSLLKVHIIILKWKTSTFASFLASLITNGKFMKIIQIQQRLIM